jgi:branched-chain amino acid transport system ATP-binding protein
VTLLQVETIDVAYGKRRALDSVSLHVEDGEIVTLLGANGAGKSTTLRAISALVRPRAGAIQFEGRDLARMRPHQVVTAGISQSPEGRRVFANLTVRENLDLGAYARRDRGAIRHDFDEVMELFPRLKERRSQRTMTLSGGEQQMVAVARGLMAEPKVLMLDELSLGLSPLLTISLFETLQKLRAEGLTMLLVEQNVRLALAISDDAYVLSEGRTVLAGPAAEVERNDEVQRSYLGL